jgi:AcrR family transcriptional regulator
MPRRQQPGHAAHADNGDSGTRERLLDAAEALFGELGFDGASVRDLTRRARANLGAVTYHFGSKENLYTEAFLRRVRAVNSSRLEELRALRATVPAGRPLPVREVLRRLLGGPLQVATRHPAFIRLLARTLTMPPPFAAEAIRREMRPLEGPFFTELSLALPRIPPPVLRFRMMLSGGGLFFLLCHWPGEGARAGLAPIQMPSREQALELLVDFAAAGLCAPAPAPHAPP